VNTVIGALITVSFPVLVLAGAGLFVGYRADLPPARLAALIGMFVALGIAMALFTGRFVVVAAVWSLLALVGLVWLQIAQTADTPAPVPAAFADVPARQAELVGSLQARGFTIVRCAGHGRRRPRAWSVIMLSADGRVLAGTIGARNATRVTFSSVAGEGRALTTMAGRQVLPQGNVYQCLGRAKPDALADVHDRAVALCDEIGLRLVSFDGPGSVAWADRAAAATRAALRGQALRLALSFWARTLTRRSEHRGFVGDQPVALARLMSWRDRAGG
jgi:hypothetical protein